MAHLPARLEESVLIAVRSEHGVLGRLVFAAAIGLQVDARDRHRAHHRPDLIEIGRGIDVDRKSQPRLFGRGLVLRRPEELRQHLGSGRSRVARLCMPLPVVERGIRGTNPGQGLSVAVEEARDRPVRFLGAARLREPLDEASSFQHISGVVAG